MLSTFAEIYREALNSVWELIRPKKVRRVARFEGPDRDRLYLPVRGRAALVVDPGSSSLITVDEALARVDEFSDGEWAFGGVEKYKHQPLIPRVVRDPGH
jgi:hypothetical protein